MSHPIHIPQAEQFDAKKGVQLKNAFLGAAVIGLTGAAVTFFANRALFAHVWLFAFMYFFTVLCGCFFWNCLHHATDSEWSVVIRRQIENLSSLLRYIAIFFIPIALSVAILYAWFHRRRCDARQQGALPEQAVLLGPGRRILRPAIPPVAHPAQPQHGAGQGRRIGTHFHDAEVRDRRHPDARDLPDVLRASTGSRPSITTGSRRCGASTSSRARPALRCRSSCSPCRG